MQEIVIPHKTESEIMKRGDLYVILDAHPESEDKPNKVLVISGVKNINKISETEFLVTYSVN